MAYYFRSGNIPHKRHTQFRKPDGTLYAEQLFSTEGFSNDYSLLYHAYAPTDIIKADDDEMIFIHEGSGILRTMYGNLEFSYGDYLVIPRGTIYQINFHTTDNR